LFADDPVVDQLGRPDGAPPGLLRYRANFSAGWSNQHFGAGLDGQYFHSRRLPAAEWPSQGDKDIRPYCQYDAYVQADLVRWLPWMDPRRSLRAQLRVNNILRCRFPTLRQ
jgi:hypothetical protein